MLLWDSPETVNEWMASRGAGRCAPGTFTALGWLNEHGRLVAGLTFYDCNGKNCFVSLAVDNCAFPPGLLKAGLFYVFSQLKVRRLTFAIEADNIASQNITRRIGATLEATLRDAGKSGDMLIYSLFPEDCAIWRKLNGRQSQRTGSPGL